MVFHVGPAGLGIGIGHAFARFPAIVHVDRRSAAVVDIGFGRLVVSSFRDLGGSFAVLGIEFVVMMGLLLKDELADAKAVPIATS